MRETYIGYSQEREPRHKSYPEDDISEGLVLLDERESTEGDERELGELFF